MNVLKFGGASLTTDTGGIDHVLEIVAAEYHRDTGAIVVVSAFDGVTTNLIAASKLAASGNESYKAILAEIREQHLAILAHGKTADSTTATIEALFLDLQSLLHGVYLTRDLSLKTRDYLLSFGEILSAQTVAAVLSAHISAVYLDARRIIRTDETFGQAEVDLTITTKLIRETLNDKEVCFVLPGFIGATDKNETTTTGRGSSDYTAALIAAALSAEELRIYTPVDGFMTADPEKVEKALVINELLYDDAIELTYFGASVLHPRAAQYAAKHNLPIRICNTYNPSAAGSLISHHATPVGAITGIASTSPVSLIRIQGIGLDYTSELASRVFSSLAFQEIEVLQTSQGCSQHSLCLAIPHEQTEDAVQVLETEFAHELEHGLVDTIEVEQECAAIAIVGSNMRRVPGTSGRFFQTLGRNGVNVITIAQGSSERIISVVITARDEEKALNAIHDAFFLSELKTLNLFLVGVGSIGSTLLRQLCDHQAHIRKTQQVDLRIVALATSTQMLFAKHGIALKNWQQQLREKGQPGTIETFLKEMIELNLSNSVFVDCTASQNVANSYQQVLSSSIAVVTPNKRANAGSYQHYRALAETAAKANVKFFYETNVGAGLPVISTLQDLIKSGDEILRVEAVLSGTLSYIFNSYNGSKPFSAVVSEAREHGYTEPDPRDDLNGLDFARKLLILGREIGMPLEESDIQVESLIPSCCSDTTSVEEFLVQLKGADDAFNKRYQAAKAEGKVLRFIGRLEKDTAVVRLTAVDQSHPFFSLSGSDNIISFVTKRYFDRPLVVKGPGAGTDVTAAGLMADILRVASYLN